MGSAAWSLLIAYAFELGLGGALLLWPISAAIASVYSALRNRMSAVGFSREPL